MSSIVFSDGDDAAYCDLCDARLIERKDGSMMCSFCNHVYNPDQITKHRMDLQPEKSKGNQDGPELVNITDFTAQKKGPTQVDIEDKMFVKRKSGMSITSFEEYFPER